MTNKIEITEQNLSHFNKRLQKALSEHFNKDVKLNEAAALFARACGKDSIHEIQTILCKEESSEKNSPITALYKYAEEPILTDFINKIDMIKNSGNHISLNLRKNEEKVYFEFIYYDDHNNIFFKFNLDLKHYDNIESEIKKSINKNKLDQKYISAIENFYNSVFKYNDNYSKLIADSVWGKYNLNLNIKKN